MIAAKRIVRNWIPAYAGMTGEYLSLSEVSRSNGAVRFDVFQFEIAS
jgi:hypothetical protein